MEEVKTKVCSKCGEEKPLTEEFWSFRKEQNCYHTICKKCKTDITRQWRIKRPDKYKQQMIKYRESNYDRISCYRSKYYQDNKERITFYNHEHYLKNKDIICLRNGEYIKKHPEIKKKSRTNYITRHSDRLKVFQKNSQLKAMHELSDGYVKALMRAHNGSIKNEDITPEMIELKRVQIQLFRKTKQFLKEEAA